MKLLARYLNRTIKRNVILHGEAGVGKTAIVEGLAQRLCAAEAPDFLRRLRIVQLNVADLLADTRFRGELESKLQRILSECTSDPDLILFLDEVHLVMGAGAGGESPLDLANILKPALARDDFRMIGATTTEEFERHVKKDAAFLRRFQILQVQEPSEAEALLVLGQWAKRIQELQGVEIGAEALQAAVSLSARLIRGRALPDKAIDLLENAAVFVKVSSLSHRAAAAGKDRPKVGRPEIAAVLEEQYGISVSAQDALDPDAVGAAFRSELVGQEGAISGVVDTLRSLRLRETGTPRPLATFLFTGPTGVGKTLAAEILARSLFGTSQALCRLNMNEFKERHELARLIGAPPGFIGHGQQGALFRFLESHPQGLVLLDEMEKCHEEIQDYFLQIFDKGEARDAHGRPADFRRIVFVMTCNLGSAPTLAGFGAAAQPSRSAPGDLPERELREEFREEFLGRIDRIVSFRALGPKEFLALLERRLQALAQDLEKQGIRLEVDPQAREPLAAACSAPGLGARGFVHEFETRVQTPVLEHARSHADLPLLRLGWEGALRLSS